MKRCSGCNNVFPATSEYWHRNKSTKDGLHTKCKICKRIYSKKYRESNKDKIKICQKRYRESNKDKIKKRKRMEYLKNTEKYKDRSRKWRENNLDRDAETKHNRYISNIEEIREYNRAYYAANSERIKQNVKMWIKENPMKFKAIQCRRRDKEALMDSKLSADDIEKIFRVFGRECFKCGSRENICIDHHKPLSKGNGISLSNVALLCKSCNSSKHTKDPDEFYTKEEISAILDIFKLLEES